MKLFSLIQIKYNQFSNSIKEYLSKTLSSYNASYGNNTVFGQLINVINGVVKNIMLYIEDSLVEQNKFTAQRKKSIYGLAAISGYNPYLGKAAGVQLSINYIPNNINSQDVIISNHETLTCTQNGMIYNIILPRESMIFSPANDNSTKYIYAVQGKFESQSFVSTGGKYYTQNFNFIGNLDTDYIQVLINGEKWDYVDSIYDMEPLSKKWTFKISPIGGIDLIFGNDVHGASLKDGDTIDVTYLLHDGELGNLDINIDTYFVFNNNLTTISGLEIDGNNVFNIQFTSDDAVTSGSNSENIDQVRKMIGFNSRSLVLANPNNYKNFLSRFSFCGYNRTWTERGSMIINSLIMKNYKLDINSNKTYFDLKEEDFKLSSAQKSSIINHIENTGNQLAGVTYNIVDPIICKYAMYLYIKMKNKDYDINQITLNIKNLIADFFSDIQSDIFIPKSDIIQLIKNNINEVDGVNVYILSERNERAIQEKSYTDITYVYNPFKNTYDKQEKIVYLYDGENPNLGLDNHGNISLQSDEQFPVLMGGWDYLNKEGDEVVITDPLIIIYE